MLRWSYSTGGIGISKRRRRKYFSPRTRTPWKHKAKIISIFCTEKTKNRHTDWYLMELPSKFMSTELPRGSIRRCAFPFHPREPTSPPKLIHARRSRRCLWRPSEDRFDLEIRGLDFTLMMPPSDREGHDQSIQKGAIATTWTDTLASDDNFRLSLLKSSSTVAYSSR